MNGRVRRWMEKKKENANGKLDWGSGVKSDGKWMRNRVKEM